MHGSTAGGDPSGSGPGPLAEVSRAVSLIDAMQVLAAWCGEGASIFLLDHAMTELRSLAGDRIRLTGELRDTMLDGEIGHIDEVTFVPLLDRWQPVGAVVIRSRDGGTPTNPEWDAERSLVAGELLGIIIRRFEDVDRVRRREHMTVSAELQWSMLPARADRICGYDIAAVLEPAYEVAGDMFDYACAGGQLVAYSFDAMGHGVRASLACSVALTTVRNARRSGGGLLDQMMAANEAIEQEWNGDVFVTGVACRFGDDRITVVNAGHEPLRRRRGDIVEDLDLESALPLGVSSDGGYFETELDPLERDETLFLLSDGSGEASGADGQPLGVQRVNDMLAGVRNTSLLSTANRFVDGVVQFIDGQSVMDDLTVVAVAPACAHGMGQPSGRDR